MISCGISNNFALLDLRSSSHLFSVSVSVLHGENLILLHLCFLRYFKTVLTCLFSQIQDFGVAKTEQEIGYYAGFIGEYRDNDT